MTDSNPADDTDARSAPGNRETESSSAASGEPDFLSQWWREFRVAAGFWTWLPISVDPPQKRTDLGHSRYLFPLVGFLIGLPAAFVFALATWLHLGSFSAAILAVATLMCLTGGRAEIATASIIEAVGRSRSPNTRLRILSEPRPGYYGVLAIVLLVLLKLALLGSVVDPWDAACVIVAAAAGSRGAAAVASWFADTMDGDRLGGLELEAGRDLVWAAALATAFLLWLLLWFWSGLIAIPVALIAAVAAFSSARALFGGAPVYSVGLIQQAAEVSILVVAVAHF